MAKTKRLTGRDGKVYLATLSELITGNGTTKLTKGEFYVPSVIADTSSGLPANCQVGVPFVGDGTSQPTTNDKYCCHTMPPKTLSNKYLSHEQNKKH